MIHIDDVRRNAVSALPRTVYQSYGDSPTIKAYTNWSIFEDALSRDDYSIGEVIGAHPVDAIPSLTFDPASNRALAHHFSKLPSFLLWDGSEHVLSRSSQTHAAQHIIFCIQEDSSVFLEDIADLSSKSLTVDVLVRPGVSLRLEHLVRGNHPQYTHIRIHLGKGSSFSGNLAVIGSNIHVHYEAFLNGHFASFALSGASITGRSDVITDAFARSESNTASVRHLLLSSPGDFLVHRGVLRVENQSSGALVDMDSAFLATGGFVAAVPQLEVLTDNVRGASHRARDLGLGEEQVFYMLSRGLRADEIMDVYVTGLVENLLGKLGKNENIRSAIKLFSESLPH